MADNDPTDQEPQDNIKDLRKAADEGRVAKAEAETLKRQLAFAKAGVDTDSKVGAMLFKAYDGELDVEAIKAEAAEVGAIKVEAPPATEPVTPAEREQTDVRTALATGSVASGTPDEDPVAISLAAGQAVRKQGGSYEDAFLAALGPTFEAALKGDERVVAR